MRRGRMLLITACLVLAVIMAGAVHATGAKEDAQYVRIATAGSGGNYYRLGAGLASLWNENLSGVQASIQATQGSPHNCELLADKEVEIAFLGTDPAYEAVNNTGAFADKPKGRYSDIRFVSHMYPNPQNFVVMNWAPQVQSIRDMRRLRVSKGTVGSHGEFLFNKLLEHLGWSAGDVVAEHTVHQTAIDQVRNRQVDVVMWPDAAPSPSINEIMETGFARMVSLDEDVIRLFSGQGFFNFPFTVPAGTYPNQPEAVQTFAYSAILVARADVSEDLVYQLTRTMYENQQYLIDVHPIARFMKVEAALDGNAIELHPGAARYYREVGVLK